MCRKYLTVPERHVSQLYHSNYNGIGNNNQTGYDELVSDCAVRLLLFTRLTFVRLDLRQESQASPGCPGRRRPLHY